MNHLLKLTMVAGAVAATGVPAAALAVGSSGPSSARPATPPPAASAAATSRVVVINESLLPGLAAGVADRLRKCGYSVRTRPAATSWERHRTKIQYEAADATEARALATRMHLAPGALVEATPTAAVLVRLGTDQVRDGPKDLRWHLQWPACER